MPLWILALGQSSSGGSGWMSEKSGNISQAARGPSLKVEKAGRGWWPQLRCEPSDLCPAPLPDLVRELEAATGDPIHNAGRVETPRGTRISVWEQKPISNCGLSSLPFVSLPWEHPARKPEAPGKGHVELSQSQVTGILLSPCGKVGPGRAHEISAQPPSYFHRALNTHH